MSLLSAAPSATPAAASGIDRRAFRRVFGRHPGGVVVITHSGSTWPTFATTRAVVVHFLAAGQADLARLFATSGVDRFAHPTRWSRTADGQPRLDDVPYYLRAHVEQRVKAGDHDIIVARVVEAVVGPDHEPLVHHAGAYRTTTDLAVWS